MRQTDIYPRTPYPKIILLKRTTNIPKAMNNFHINKAKKNVTLFRKQVSMQCKSCKKVKKRPDQGQKVFNFGMKAEGRRRVVQIETRKDC